MPLTPEQLQELKRALTKRREALETEAHAVWVRDLDRCHSVLHRLRRRAAVPLEGKLHVVGGDGVAVVELRALAEHELIDKAVFGQAPRLGEARRHGFAGHRLHQRVVQRVEHHERCGNAGRLRGVEPGWGERDVNGPGHLPFGRRVARRGPAGCGPEDQHGREETSKVSHGEVSLLTYHRFFRDGSARPVRQQSRNGAPGSWVLGDSCARRPRPPNAPGTCSTRG